VGGGALMTFWSPRYWKRWASSGSDGDKSSRIASRGVWQSSAGNVTRNDFLPRCGSGATAELVSPVTTSHGRGFAKTTRGFLCSNTKRSGDSGDSDASVEVAEKFLSPLT